MEYLFVYIVAAVVWGVIWGFATKKVIENKGYYENWFWWGFFFGWIALIVALSKPEYRHESYSGSRPALNVANPSTAKSSSGDEWKCYHCARVNPGYLTTCNCGLTLQMSKRAYREKDERVAEASKKNSEMDNLKLLKEYKDMLDSGIITEEEFAAKKAQLLK